MITRFTRLWDLMMTTLLVMTLTISVFTVVIGGMMIGVDIHCLTNV